jgi:hypothetical protein
MTNNSGPSWACHQSIRGCPHPRNPWSTVSRPVGGIQLGVRHAHRPTSYNLATWYFVFAFYIVPEDGRRTWVPNGSRTVATTRRGAVARARWSLPTLPPCRCRSWRSRGTQVGRCTLRRCAPAAAVCPCDEKNTPSGGPLLTANSIHPGRSRTSSSDGTAPHCPGSSANSIPLSPDRARLLSYQ